MTDQSCANPTSSPTATSAASPTLPEHKQPQQGQAGALQHQQQQPPRQQAAPETPSILAMQALATPSPLVASAAAAAAAVAAVPSSGASSDGSSGASTSGGSSSDEEEEEDMAVDSSTAHNPNSADAAQLPAQAQPKHEPPQPKQEAPAPLAPVAVAPPAVNRVKINLRALLPKKTKHGRIGGSLYRALRDAGVDIGALKIPRGRPPRAKVGQKRPKRPTLLGLIKAGAELPMLPGMPALQLVVTDEDVMEEDDDEHMIVEARHPHSGSGSGSASPPGSAPSPATDAEGAGGFASPPQAALTTRRSSGSSSGGKGGRLGTKAPSGLREASNMQREARRGGRRVGLGAEDEDGEEGEGGEHEEDEVEGMTADDAATGLLLLGK